MTAPGPVLTKFWSNNANAILVNFYAGEQMAPAMFNVIFGQVNPSGKLPVTFPNSNGELNLT